MPIILQVRVSTFASSLQYSTIWALMHFFLSFFSSISWQATLLHWILPELSPSSQYSRSFCALHSFFAALSPISYRIELGLKLVSKMKWITYYVVDMDLPALEQINLRHAFVPECSAMSQNVSICCRKHFRLSVMFDNFIDILRIWNEKYFIFSGNQYFSI